MSLRDDIHRQRAAILEIAARHGASNVGLFGSVVRGEERPDSDIDLLVDLAPDRGFGEFLAMAEELEVLLGHRVEIVTRRGLSPYFRPYIEAEVRPI